MYLCFMELKGVFIIVTDQVAHFHSHMDGWDEAFYMYVSDIHRYNFLILGM